MVSLTLPWFGLHGLPGYRGYLVVQAWPLRVQRVWARRCPLAPGTPAQAAQALIEVGR
jgi:hypothetical protein